MFRRFCATSRHFHGIFTHGGHRFKLTQLYNAMWSKTISEMKATTFGCPTELNNFWKYIGFQAVEKHEVFTRFHGVFTVVTAALYFSFGIPIQNWRSEQRTRWNFNQHMRWTLSVLSLKLHASTSDESSQPLIKSKRKIWIQNVRSKIWHQCRLYFESLDRFRGSAASEPTRRSKPESKRRPCVPKAHLSFRKQC